MEHNLNIEVKLPKLTGKEIPRMFQTEMVQAILRGEKIQTRRTDGLKEINKSPDAWTFDKVTDEGYFRFYDLVEEKLDRMETLDIKPRYNVGDVIWVKETYAENNEHLDNKYSYKADSMNPAIRKWKSAMMMPKAAARIKLFISAVRVERLYHVSADDANYEGIRLTEDEIIEALSKLMSLRQAYTEKFKQLWIKINGQESWDVNPWVNVVTFYRIYEHKIM